MLDNLYGTKTSYYGRINFWGLIDIVDALGGIDVYSDYSFTTAAGDVAGYGDREYSYTEGWNHIAGTASGWPSAGSATPSPTATTSG